jgi:hypothetical protein
MSLPDVTMTPEGALGMGGGVFMAKEALSVSGVWD